MPWSETTKMRERMRLVLDAEGELFTMTELCERYGISRMTRHKHLAIMGDDRPDGCRLLADGFAKNREDFSNRTSETRFEASLCISQEATQDEEVCKFVLLLRVGEASETLFPFRDDFTQVGLGIAKKLQEALGLRVLGLVSLKQPDVRLELELSVVEPLK